MRLHALGVIRDAQVEFGPGLTVLSGETGAGKTMVVSGLGLLLGGKADPATVRQHHDTASVEGHWDVAAVPAVAQRFTEAGADLDDGIATVVRTVAAEGRSRAFVGGRSVPTVVLTDVAADVVAVHGQNDQLRLRSAAQQLQALDRYAGPAVTGPLAEYRTLWQQLRDLERDLNDITTRARERAQEAELLRLGIAEIERIDPHSGEDEALRAESQRLAHAEELRAAASTAQLALSGDMDATQPTDVLTRLAEARHALDAVRHHDTDLGALADQLAEVAILAQDAAAAAAAYADNVDADPARLAAVQERRAQLTTLTKAYGEDVDAVLAWASTASDRLLALDNDDERIAQLRTQREQLRGQLAELAGDISAARHHAAQQLSQAVTTELADLAMPNAQLNVAITHTPDADGLPVRLPDDQASATVAAGPDGVDEVEFTFIPHAGAPARPLAKGASGGELSRVMLGLEVVVAAADPVPTFVFDEVDAGVGGSAALGIGRRLAALAQHAQVIVVTHLAQVAAYADRHLVIRKASDGQVTESGVHQLSGDERVTELARMLSGMADSDTGKAHAAELLATAAAEKRHAAGTTKREASEAERPAGKAKTKAEQR